LGESPEQPGGIARHPGGIAEHPGGIAELMGENAVDADGYFK